MSSKNRAEVLIDGKIYTMSGYESEEYLQRVAAYLNNKISEIKNLEGYHRLSSDLQSILLNLNTADDYFKAKKQADNLENELSQKDKELYEIKHELISEQIKLETAKKIGRRFGLVIEGEDDLMRPEVNVVVGSAYLIRLIGKYGNLREALVAYNLGHTAVDKLLEKNAPLPTSYYEGVVRKYRDLMNHCSI